MKLLIKRQESNYRVLFFKFEDSEGEDVLYYFEDFTTLREAQRRVNELQQNASRHYSQ